VLHRVRYSDGDEEELDAAEMEPGMRAAAGFAAGIHTTGPCATWMAKWEAQLARLVAYKVEHGNCNVPQGWAEDPRLARWVRTQRVLKRKLDRGEPSEGMTAERAARLTALGFAWSLPAGGRPKEAGWEAQLARLVTYKAAHGDGSVGVGPHAERPARHPTPAILQGVGQDGEGGSPVFPGAGGEAAADPSDEAGESGAPCAPYRLGVPGV
jgi:hypothetical protein